MEEKKEVAKLVQQALDTLYKNKECLVAKFIIDNPDVKAEDIELVSYRMGTNYTIVVRKRETIK